MTQMLELCRICTKFVNSTESVKLFDTGEQKEIQQIASLTGIYLKNAKNLPQNMCAQCQSDLDQAFEFRTRCIYAQEYFINTELNQKENEQTSSLKAEKDNKRKKEILEDVEEDRSVLSEELFEVEYVHDENFKSEYVEPLRICSDVNEDNDEIDDNVNDNNDVEGDDIDDDGDVNAFLSDDPEYKLVHSDVEIPEMLPPTDEMDKVEGGKCVKRKKMKNNKTANKRSKEKIDKPNRFICDQCGNRFAHHYRFITHLKRHTGEKSFHCEVCPDKFFTRSELNRHIRRHTGERPFGCKYCDRHFSDYSTRIKHERTHTNERPFKCNQCDKTFTRSYILNNHMRVHTRERSYRCDLCDKSFQLATHLLVHTRSIMHKQNEQKLKNT